MGRRGTPPSDSFTTADVYAFERELAELHPLLYSLECKGGCGAFGWEADFILFSWSY